MSGADVYEAPETAQVRATLRRQEHGVAALPSPSADFSPLQRSTDTTDTPAATGQRTQPLVDSGHWINHCTL